MKFLNRFKRKNQEDSPEVPATADSSPVEPLDSAAPETVPAPVAILGDELRLELGDFLHRIPNHALRPGSHDLRSVLRFSIPDLIARAERGEMALPLTEISRQMPQIFRHEIRPDDPATVRFPWQKVAALISRYRPPDEESAHRADVLATALACVLHDKKPSARPFDPSYAPPPSPPPSTVPAEPIVTEDTADIASAPDASESAHLAPENETFTDVVPPTDTGDPTLSQPSEPSSPVETRQPDTAAKPPAVDLPAAIQAQIASIRHEHERHIAELERKIEDLQRDSNLASVVAERDALLRQKNHLSSQLQELSRRGMSLGQRYSDGSTLPGGHQRQIDEYQRRITLMEAAQRETALQLAREREGRAKAEKLLAAAEKLQEQSATYMETAKAEMRKDVEASVRSRELEARKIQKDLQDQVARLTEEQRRTAEELENALARLAAGEGFGAGAQDPDLQAEAIRQLEADVESYRERLKVLLKERDAARAEAQKRDASIPASASGSAETSPDMSALRARVEELTASHAELSRQLEVERKTANDDRESTAARLRAETLSLEQQLTKVIQERDALRSREKELLNTLEEAQVSRLELTSKLQHSELEHVELEHARAEHPSASPQVQSELAALRAECVELQQQLQIANERASAATARANAASETIQALEADLTDAREQHQSIVADLHAERDEMTRERYSTEQATNSELAKLQTEIARLRQEAATPKAVAPDPAFVASLEAARAAQAVAESRVAEVLAQSAKDRAQFEADLESVRSQLVAAQEAAASMPDASAMEERIAQLESALAEAEARPSASQGFDNTEMEHLRKEVAALTAERDNLATQRDGLLRRITRINEDHKRMLDELLPRTQGITPPTIDIPSDEPTNVIEVEIPQATEPGIAAPRIRPVKVQPPKIRRS